MALLAYWKQICIGMCIIIIFLAGWHVRGLQEAAKAEVRLQAEIARIKLLQEVVNKRAANYEKTVAAINIKTDEVNQKLKVTYADSAYRCIIPNDGLHILATANR